MKNVGIVASCCVILRAASAFTNINIGISPSLQSRPRPTIPAASGRAETKTTSALHLFRKKKDSDAAAADPDADAGAAVATAEPPADLVRPEQLFPGELVPDQAEDDVKITSPSVLPPVPASALVVVYYCEQAISSLGTIGEVIEAYHAGMAFEISNYQELVASGEIADAEAVPREFTIEWYAENFPFGAFLPQIVKMDAGSKGAPPSVSKVGLQWENDSWAFYSPVYKPSRWSKGRTRVGTIAGSALPAYGAWIVDYCNGRPGYEAFEVWDRPYLESGVTRRLRSSATCSSFTQGSMEKLYELGKEQKVEEGIEGVDLDEAFSMNKELIMRSYVPLISKTKVTKVDLDDDLQANEVREFFIEFNKAARGVDGVVLSTSDFIRLIANKLETFFVYDTPADDYYRVPLAPPYFAISSLYQPVSLPWQRLDLEGTGELRDPAAFADEKTNFAEELGAAVSGAVDLAKRRLPPVLRKKLQEKISNEGIVFLVALVAAAGAGLFATNLANFEVDFSFVSGIAVGAVGAKLLK